MLVAVIPVKDYKNSKQLIHQVQDQADCIELRLDYLITFNFDQIARLRHESKLPVIFTLRKKSQGGLYIKNEEKRLKDILLLCELNPDYIDLEHDIPEDFLKKITLHYSNIKLICSYHNFNETPENLLTLLQAMQKEYFYGYKIATTANNTLDALRMVDFINSNQKKYILTGICMGEDGQSTRILSPIIQNAMTYASIDNSELTASGQLTLNQLLTVYRHRKLNASSKIYALLGDPINFSVGHILHNQAIEFLGENAVYVKLRATENELPDIINLAKKLRFAGFSITMPLKESILPLLDEIEPSSQPIKAINSVISSQKKLIGFNTDGMGAIQILSQYVDMAKQKILILGAGGAARAIAYESLQHKAKVIIVNRTLNKAQKLADEFGCESYSLKNLNCLKETSYTILINTLPASAYSEELITSHDLLSNTLVMDIVYQPIHTPFLKIAKGANCLCIFGYEMYIHQALLQIKRWFNPNEKLLNEIKKKMNQYFLQANLKK